MFVTTQNESTGIECWNLKDASFFKARYSSSNVFIGFTLMPPLKLWFVWRAAWHGWAAMLWENNYLYYDQILLSPQIFSNRKHYEVLTTYMLNCLIGIPLLSNALSNTSFISSLHSQFGRSAQIIIVKY